MPLKLQKERPRNNTKPKTMMKESCTLQPSSNLHTHINILVAFTNSKC